MRSRFAALLLCLVGALALPVSTAGAAPSDSAGRFIVTLRDAADPRGVAAEYGREGADVDFVYTAALNGFAGTLTKGNLADLQRDRRVTRIERDGVARASDTQSNATWGLDRVDQRALPLDSSYTYSQSGSGVTAYIIDTGIRASHDDLRPRVSGGFTSIDDGRGTDDCNGHGTHVAGTVGGTTWGVAKSVSLVPVRVLNCRGSGTWSGVIAGVDWVTLHAVKPAVANMSLGGGANSSVDTAVRNSISSGVTYAVAAGNSTADACGYSPARVAEALTIGATTSSDAKASYSNFGDCIDLFAPGSSITSAWYKSDSSTNTISGTSMASPHVAGAAVLYLTSTPDASPATVGQAIADASTKGIVTSSSSVNNHLLFSLLEPVKTGTVSGTVTSSADSSAIAGASVTVGGKSTTTSSTGAYTLLDVPTGSQPFEVSATGFDTKTGTVTVAETGTVLDVALTPASTDGGDTGGSTLTGSSVNNGSSWTATVTSSASGDLSGTWDYSGGTDTCASSTCSLSGIPKKVGSVTFTSSTGESLTVAKP